MVFMFTSRCLAIKPNGEEVLLSVDVSSPKLGEQDYTCTILIPTLDVNENIFGVDELQAYCMTYKRLEMLFRELVSQGYKFYSPDQLDSEVDVLSCYFF